MPYDSDQSRAGNHFSAGGQTRNVASPRSSAGPSETAEFTSAYFQSSNHPGASSQPRESNTATPSASRATSPSDTFVHAVESGRSVDMGATTDPGYAQSNYSSPQGGALPYGPARGGGSDPRNSYHYQRKKRGKIIAGVIAAIVVLVVIVGGICGFTMFRDYKNITAKVPTLMEQASGLKDSVMAGDGETVRTTAATIASEVSGMNDTLSGLPWQIASLVPVVGQDVQSARTLVSEADRLCQYALIPACDSLADVKLSNLMTDGAVNVDLLQSLVSTLQNISPVIQQSAETIEALPEARIGKVSELVTKVQDGVRTANSAVTALNEAAPYLPQMLGADGNVRHYLIVAQNNVELRSTGGFPGSAGVMTVVDGRIELGDFTGIGASAGEGLEWYDQVGFGVTDEEIGIFGDRVGKIPADTPYIFDFPRAYSLFSAMYTDQKGGTIDGVIAIDPVFLQYLLKLTGGITINGVEVNGDNAARLLMHDAYAMFDTDTQDTFFSAVASAAFSNIMGNLGNLDLPAFADVVTRGIEEGRLQMWMVNEDEENIIKQTGAGGEVKTDPTAPQLGVYAGDDTASKISWYLSTNTTMDAGTKNADGSTTYHATSTFTNNLSLAEAEAQPTYVTGYSPLKRNVSDMFIHIYLVAPSGGTISNVSSTGGDFSTQNWSALSWNGFGVYTASPLINGQETVTVTYDVTTSPEATEPMVIDTTATAQAVAGWQQ